MLIERLRGEPERALPHAQALQSMDLSDEQVALELRSLDTSARESAMRSASAGLGRPRGGLPDAYFALNEHQRSQHIRYCRSPDGVQIAYAISGKGPPILRAAHWMSHLQYEWESPAWRHWIDPERVLWILTAQIIYSLARSRPSPISCERLDPSFRRPIQSDPSARPHSGSALSLRLSGTANFNASAALFQRPRQHLLQRGPAIIEAGISEWRTK